MIKASWMESSWAGSCNACAYEHKYKKVWELRMGSFYGGQNLVIRLCKECLKELIRKTTRSK